MKKEITDSFIMPFGKYEGEKIGNVPASYLIYMYESKFLFGDVKKYVGDNLNVLQKEANKEYERRLWRECDASEADIY